MHRMVPRHGKIKISSPQRHGFDDLVAVMSTGKFIFLRIGDACRPATSVDACVDRRARRLGEFVPRHRAVRHRRDRGAGAAGLHDRRAVAHPDQMIASPVLALPGR